MPSDKNINIRGDVSGNVVGGDGNVVGNMWAGGATNDRPDRRLGHALEPRLGFTLDVVGYGARPAPLKEDIAVRLSTLVGDLLGELGVDVDETDDDGGAGDGMTVFLPRGTDPTGALPRLLAGIVARLERDNARYRDRMRLRAAVGSGLVGAGPTGFKGELVVDLNRLVDSGPLRDAVRYNDGADAVVLVAGELYDQVVRPGYLPAALNSFRRVEVAVKEYSAIAWLWMSTVDS